MWLINRLHPFYYYKDFGLRLHHLELSALCGRIAGQQPVQRRCDPALPAQPGQQATDLAVPLRAGLRLFRQLDRGEDALEDGGWDVVVAEDGGEQVEHLC